MTFDHCSRCLYSTAHPFGLVLDPEQICSGCRVHEEKFSLDWEARERHLAKLLAEAKTIAKGSEYDCVVPVRGTPEYFFVLDLLKNKYGLRVLAVSYNHQFNTAVGIRNLARMKDHFDVDFRQYTSSTPVYRKIVRESLVRLRSARWPAIAGETSFPVWTAIELGIPLIVWPLHQATEQVGAHSYCEQIEMTRTGRHSFDLLDTEPQDLVRPETLLHPFDMEDLLYPPDRLLRRSGVRGVYLANFLPWDSRSNAEFAVAHLGALACQNDRTFDTYDRVDDGCYMGIHDRLKFSKFSYSRVTDSLCTEIRFGRVTRDVAVEIESFYQSDMALDSVSEFTRWLGSSNSNDLNWLVQWSEGAQTFFSEPLEASVPPDLSVSARKFIDAYHVNAPAISTNRTYELIGKGLEFDE